MASDDPFEDVINIEQRLYSQGYQQGLDDGERDGRIEGRQFGMQKGFEKFLESGRLAGNAIIWASRMPKEQAQSQARGQSQSQSMEERAAEATGNISNSSPAAVTTTTALETSSQHKLPPLPDNGRLEKNIKTLYALVEPDTLSTENTDEAVQDFDDRIKRAQGKAKVIERMIG